MDKALRSRKTGQETPPVAFEARLKALTKTACGCFHKLPNNRSSALHDLRVSLRRIAAVLDLGDVQKRKKAGREIKKLLAHSNKARDIQVLIEWLEARQRHGVFAREQKLMGHFKKKFEKALCTFALYGQPHMTRFQGVMHVLKCAEPRAAAAARRVVADRVVVLKKALREGRELRGVSAEKSLHQARLLCKAARYMAELLPPPEGMRRVCALKQLQEQLGQLHDLEVMKRMIEKYTRTIARNATAQSIDRAMANDAVMTRAEFTGESRAFFNCLKILRTLARAKRAELDNFMNAGLRALV
jgi:CHAD domain-containing protein